jgi:hypothetical protein
MAEAKGRLVSGRGGHSARAARAGEHERGEPRRLPLSPLELARRRRRSSPPSPTMPSGARGLASTVETEGINAFEQVPPSGGDSPIRSS